MRVRVRVRVVVMMQLKVRFMSCTVAKKGSSIDDAEPGLAGTTEWTSL